MKLKKVLEILLREMRAYGQAYRNDWHDFDGRQLKKQLEELAEWAEHAMKHRKANEEFTRGTEFEKEDD